MGGAAGGVHLPVVVDFQDFNVRLGKTGGGFLGDAAQHRNAKAHIVGVEHRDFFRGGINEGLLLFRVSGGADDQGAALGEGIPGYFGNSSVVGKVDDRFGLHIGKLLCVLCYPIFSIQAHKACHLLPQSLLEKLTHGAVGAPDYRSH